MKVEWMRLRPYATLVSLSLLTLLLLAALAIPARRVEGERTPPPFEVDGR
jgi:hypothetical protein